MYGRTGRLLALGSQRRTCELRFDSPDDLTLPQLCHLVWGTKAGPPVSRHFPAALLLSARLAQEAEGASGRLVLVGCRASNELSANDWTFAPNHAEPHICVPEAQNKFVGCLKIRPSTDSDAPVRPLRHEAITGCSTMFGEDHRYLMNLSARCTPSPIKRERDHSAHISPPTWKMIERFMEFFVEF